MRRPVATLVLLALGVAGCGGSSKSDEDAIRSTIRTYFTAFADGDGAKACDQLGSEVRGKIEQATKKDCPAALEAAGRQPEIKRYIGQIRHVTVDEVDITGSNASAKVRALGQTTTMPLHKVGGAWKIQDNQVATGG